MRPRPSSRSNLLAVYLQCKAVIWPAIGLVGWWLALDSLELWEASALRLFAFFLLIFAVPGVLMWITGALVRYRNKAGWYLAVLYLMGVVGFKVGGGIAELPVEAWHWVAHRFPPQYLSGFRLFGFLAAIVFAADMAALLAFLSPWGRESFRIGPKSDSTPSAEDPPPNH